MRYIPLVLILVLSACGDKKGDSAPFVSTNSAQAVQQRVTSFELRYQNSPPIIEWTAPTGSNESHTIDMCHRARCVAQFRVECPNTGRQNCVVTAPNYHLEVSDTGAVKTYRIELCGHDELGLGQHQYARVNSGDRGPLIGTPIVGMGTKCRRP